MPPTRSPIDLIDEVIKRAPAMHRAGITHLEIDGLTVTLSPPPPEMPTEKPKPERVYTDPLSDPATFSALGGRVPGYKRPQPIDPDLDE
jgi:hypothetical protein